MTQCVCIAAGLLGQLFDADTTIHQDTNSPWFLSTSVFHHKLTFDYETDLLRETTSEEILSPAIGFGLRMDDQFSLISEASLGRLEYKSYDYEDVYDFAKFNYDYAVFSCRAEWNLELAPGVAIAPTIGVGYCRADYKLIVDDLTYSEDDKGEMLIGGVTLSLQIEENAWLQIGYRYQEFEFKAKEIYGPTDVEHQGLLVNVNWEF